MGLSIFSTQRLILLLMQWLLYHSNLLVLISVVTRIWIISRRIQISSMGNNSPSWRSGVSFKHVQDWVAWEKVAGLSSDAPLSLWCPEEKYCSWSWRIFARNDCMVKITRKQRITRAARTECRTQDVQRSRITQPGVTQSTEPRVTQIWSCKEGSVNACHLTGEKEAVCSLNGN